MVKFLQILKANSYSWHKISFERVLYLYFFGILLYKDELIELDARVGCQILYKSSACVEFLRDFETSNVVIAV